MNHDIKWFSLERIEDLEREISSMVANKRTMRDGIGCHLGLNGLRASEVTRALAKHFQPLNHSLYVCPYDPKTKKCRPLKHGVPRTIKLHQSLVDAIVAYRSMCQQKQSKWLLPNRSGELIKTQLLSRKGREMLLRLGMMDDPSTRFHMLRHTCAMRILAETNDIMLVKKHLGHSNVQTTMAYLDCLKEVPSTCLAKLHGNPTSPPRVGQQLSLFNPFGDPESGAVG